MRRHRLVERLRAYLIAGLLVTGPISLTLWLLWVFVSWIDGLVAQLVPRAYDPATYLPFRIPGLGLVIVAAGLILIGWATAGVLGRFFVRVYERVLERLPVIRGLYGATKQIFETVLAKQSNTFREVVLVEFPRKEMWSLAFITGKPEGEIQDVVAEEAVSVYVPTTPNPTSGYLVFVPRRDIIVLDMTVEEAIKFVISGGIVAPPDRRKLAGGAVPPAEPSALEPVGPAGPPR
jgi:uncharacterized membrane protein